jgi:hypothetical protein
MQHVARLFTDAKPYSELHGNTLRYRAAADVHGDSLRGVGTEVEAAEPFCGVQVPRMGSAAIGAVGSGTM